jgi:arylsulfatase A-like enzyme
MKNASGNRTMISLSVIFALIACSEGHTASKPNILLIYVDDLGYGDLASYGHPVIKTPNLDELADDGLRLTNYYAPSALCSPSRAGLLTGRHPYRTGIESWIPKGSGVYLRAAEITLAEVLKSTGYSTALIGKWHLNSDLGSNDEPQPTDQGFDYFYGHNAFQIPSNRNPTNIYRNKEALGVQQGFTAELYASEAIAWLEQRDENSPFFLMLSMAEPHVTIENPAEYNEKYETYTNGAIVPIRNRPGGPPKDDLIPRGPGEYYANISYMDAQLGRVFDWIKSGDLYDDTVVIFASDNGPVTSDWLAWYEVNSHGSTGGYRGRKHYLYDGGIKVPAIIRWPGVVGPGTTSDELIVGTDFFATLAKIAGGEIPQDRAIDGVDIRPALEGMALPPRTILWALADRAELDYAIRQDSWKLLLDDEKQPKELYNLAEDPLELFNLIDDETLKSEQLFEAFVQEISLIEDDPLNPRHSH